MDQHIDKIELRSEKIRNIIGQIPPHFIRSGTTAISLIIILFLIGSYFFKYNYVIKAEAVIINCSEKLIGYVYVPADQRFRIATGQIVLVSFPGISGMHGEGIICQIDAVPDRIALSANGARCKIGLKLPVPLVTVSGRQINLYGMIKGEAEIQAQKISFFERITDPVKLLFHKNSLPTMK